MYMLYTNYYVESLSAILKRYSAPISFKIKTDALIGETYAEINNKIVSFVELHLIPIYATDVEMKLTDIDLNHENDKTVVLSGESPYLITLSYDVDKGVKAETTSDDAAVIVGSIIEYLDIDVSADGYISEKAFLEFNNVDITVYEIDDELKVIDLLKPAKYDNADAVSGGVV